MYMDVLYARYAGALMGQKCSCIFIYTPLFRHFLPRLIYMDVLYADFAGAKNRP